MLLAIGLGLRRGRPGTDEATAQRTPAAPIVNRALGDPARHRRPASWPSCALGGRRLGRGPVRPRRGHHDGPDDALADAHRRRARGAASRRETIFSRYTLANRRFVQLIGVAHRADLPRDGAELPAADLRHCRPDRARSGASACSRRRLPRARRARQALRRHCHRGARRPTDTECRTTVERQRISEQLLRDARAPAADSPARHPAGPAGADYDGAFADELRRGAKSGVGRRSRRALRRAGAALGERHVRAARRLPGDGRRRARTATIKHVMSGVNPQGVQVVSFKPPSSEELDHNFLWRISKAAAGAGPDRHLQPLALRGGRRAARAPGVARRAAAARRQTRGPEFWDERYEDINAFERHLDRNGTKIVKFFLHVSKAEQKRRFLARLDTPNKEWKFNAADVAERAHWDDYMAAFDARADRHLDAVGAVVRDPGRPQVAYPGSRGADPRRHDPRPRSAVAGGVRVGAQGQRGGTPTTRSGSLNRFGRPMTRAEKRPGHQSEDHRAWMTNARDPLISVEPPISGGRT